VADRVRPWGCVVDRAVFINYRGEDSHSYGALLYNELARRFGEDLIFLDAESIPAGADSVQELLDGVRSARVLLAIIGQRWLTTTNPVTGQRRIDEPTDWIRRELAEAFAAGVRVIPVLTDQADLPREADLPADIVALSRCQYRYLRRREPTAGLARIVTDLTNLDPVLAAAARCRDSGPRHPPTPQADEQMRRLATTSRNQWTAAANDRRLAHPAPLPIRWRRSTAPVAGPVSAASHPRFDPLPGLTAITSGELREGTHDALHRIYGGLPSGRLLLLGKPGSGKTAAAILLLLDALRYREQAMPDDQARIPVPVLFTLHGWDPDRGDSVIDWMAGKLAETYPMFHSGAGRRAATDLLTAGRVAGFLDGLDEIPEPVRPRVLAALADAPFRLVLLARTAEAVAAANHGPLAGAVAVELQPVTPADAAVYLLQPLVHPPPAPWRKISDHLARVAARWRSASAVSEALNTPLALSLLRDVYGPTGPVDEILDVPRFPAAADIENHLLDHAIIAAYTPRPGHPRPRYTPETAQRTLRYLATQLTEHGTRDLAWWHIPTWTPHRSRMIAAAVVNMLVNVVTFAPGLGFVFGPALGLSSGLLFGLVTVFVLVGKRWRGVPIMPQRITRLTYRSTAHNLVFGLTIGLAGGLVAGLSTGPLFGLSTGVASGLSVGLAAGLAGVTLVGVARHHTDIDESPLGPADVWRHDRNAGLAYVLVFGLVVGLLAVLTARLVPGFPLRLMSRLPIVLSVGFAAALVVALGFAVIVKRVGTAVNSPGGAAVTTALAAAQLAIRHKIPLRPIAFLEDARSRHLLRTVGPVYQFRHATLQDRLTQPTPERSSHPTV
jgi:hypothetical protein